jgi:hypothetical protein
MGEREYCDILRLRAIAVLENAIRTLSLHPENTTGSMAPHVAIESLARAAAVTRDLQALADAAKVNP